MIVGAGLAGCLLAWRLHQAGIRVRLIGDDHRPAAFQVAAGVINPVTGRWMTKTWNFDHIYPVAQKTYLEIEGALGLKFYHPTPEIRFCQNGEDLKRLRRRLKNPRYADVLGAYLEPGATTPHFQDSHGSFEILQAAYVDLPGLVSALRHFFEEAGLYERCDFHHGALSPDGDLWNYGAMRAKGVIFCEGIGLRSNPFFSKIVLQPAKGETLLCRSSGFELAGKLVHHKKWFLPYPDGSFRIGATYAEDDLAPIPTDAGRLSLLNDAESALRKPHKIEILQHLAGIRPGTPDSRPIIGAHPRLNGLYLINGLGSKGASTGPAMAKAMCAHLLRGQPIDPDVDLRRQLDP